MGTGSESGKTAEVTARGYRIKSGKTRVKRVCLKFTRVVAGGSPMPVHRRGYRIKSGKTATDLVLPAKAGIYVASRAGSLGR